MRRAAGWGIAVFGLLVAGAGGYWWFSQDEPASATTTLTPTTSATLFAPSFNGTRADGRFRLDGDKLVLDPGLFEFFDYYLAAQGERTLEDIRQQIEAELTASLPQSAATEAKRLLQAYLGYKRALVSLERPGAGGDNNTIEHLRSRLSDARAARSRHFSPLEIKALFGNQDNEEDQALARLEIQQDAHLSAEQKQQRLAALDAQLTPEQRKQKDQPLEHATLQNDVETARKNGASEAQIFQLRAQKLGSEAAQRLASLDQEEQQWRSRIDAYLAERGKVLSSQMLPAEQEAVIERLRQERFSKSEQQRLAAFEEAGSSIVR